MIIAKVGGKCDISFLVKMCYLYYGQHQIPSSKTTLDTLIGVSALTIVIRVRVDFHCRVIFSMRTCVKFTFANKIEAMYERSHVSVY